MKRFLGILLLCCILAAGLYSPAYAVFSEELKLDYEQINNVQWMHHGATNETTRNCAVLNSRSELFVYQFRSAELYERGVPAIYRPELTNKVADNVQKYELYNSSEGELFILKKDGTLWIACPHNQDELMGTGMQTYSSFYEPVMIADNVVDITSSCCFLTKAGKVYYVESIYPADVRYRKSQPTKDSYSLKLLVENVDCLSKGYYASGNTIHYNTFWGGTDPAFPVELDAKITRLYTIGTTYFAITEKGDLWSWGRNAKGESGNGGKWDYATLIGANSDFSDSNSNNAVAALFAEKPRKILSNIRDLFFEGSTGNYKMYAADETGNIWSWGRGNPATTVLVRDKKSPRGSSMGNITLPKDMTGWTPKKVPLSEYLEFYCIGGELRVYFDGRIMARSFIPDTSDPAGQTLDGLKVPWTELPSWKDTAQ